MIKKITITTLILSLMTTSAFSIIPQNASKAFAFFQDTRKSFLQSILEFVREKVQSTGCYLYEGKKVKTGSKGNGELLNSGFAQNKNQEDDFVEYNQKDIEKLYSYENSVKNFKEVHDESARKAFCLALFEEYETLPTEGKNFFHDKNAIKLPLKMYYQSIQQFFKLVRTKQLTKDQVELINNAEKVFYSTDPSLIVIVEMLCIEKMKEEFYNFLSNYITIQLFKYCQECQKKNNWD